MYVVLKAIEGPYFGKTKRTLLKSPDYLCRLGRTVGTGIFLRKWRVMSR